MSLMEEGVEKTVRYYHWDCNLPGLICCRVGGFSFPLDLFKND